MNVVTGTSYKNDAWYYALFDNDNSTTCCTGSTYSGFHTNYMLVVSIRQSFSAAGTRYAGYYTAATGTTSAGTVVYSGTCSIWTTLVIQIYQLKLNMMVW